MRGLTVALLALCSFSAGVLSAPSRCYYTKYPSQISGQPSSVPSTYYSTFTVSPASESYTPSTYYYTYTVEPAAESYTPSTYYSTFTVEPVAESYPTVYYSTFTVEPVSESYSYYYLAPSSVSDVPSYPTYYSTYTVEPVAESYSYYYPAPSSISDAPAYPSYVYYTHTVEPVAETPCTTVSDTPSYPSVSDVPSYPSVSDIPSYPSVSDTPSYPSVSDTSSYPSSVSDAPYCPPTGSVQISRVDYDGSGCPTGSIAHTLSEDGTNLQLAFDSYTASVGDNDTTTASSADCHLTIYFDSPKGWSFSAYKTEYVGYVDLENKVTAYQESEYQFEGDSKSKKCTRHWTGPLMEDYRVDDVFEKPSMVWSSCEETTTILHINTEIGADNTNNPYGSGLITTDSINHKTTQIIGLEWNQVY